MTLEERQRNHPDDVSGSSSDDEDDFNQQSEKGGHRADRIVSHDRIEERQPPSKKSERSPVRNRDRSHDGRYIYIYIYIFALLYPAFDVSG